MNELPLADLAGISELCSAFGVTRATVCNWAARYDDFPEAAATLRMGRLYRFSQVQQWCLRTWTHRQRGQRDAHRHHTVLPVSYRSALGPDVDLRQSWPAGDLAGSVELCELLGTSRGQVNMWVKRSWSTLFPSPLLQLVRGPVFSRAEVTLWWEIYRVSGPRRQAMRAAQLRRVRQEQEALHA